MPGAAGAQLTALRGLSKLIGKPALFQVRMPPLARLKPLTPYAILLLLTGPLKLDGYIAKFLVMAGTYPKYKLAAAIAALAVILAAIYILLMYKHLMTGPKPEGERFAAVRDLDVRVDEVCVYQPPPTDVEHLAAVIDALA